MSPSFARCLTLPLKERDETDDVVVLGCCTPDFATGALQVIHPAHSR